MDLRLVDYIHFSEQMQDQMEAIFDLPNDARWKGSNPLPQEALVYRQDL